MALFLSLVLGLQQQAHLDRRQRGMLESRAMLDEVGAGRPREVVDVLLIEMVDLIPLIGGDLPLDAGGAHRPARRHRQPDIVDAKVGEELRRVVELMAVPAAILEHADLRKPLGDEEVVVDDAGSREGPRHVRRPRDLDLDAAARRDRRVERDVGNRPIVRVAVVGRDVAQTVGPRRARRRW